MTETLPETVTVELSLPSRVLSPNARCHWSVRAKARAAQREEARWVARSAVQLVKPLWPSAHITVTPYYPDRRRRDTDNLLSALKAAIDGIVDAGVLADLKSCIDGLVDAIITVWKKAKRCANGVPKTLTQGGCLGSTTRFQKVALENVFSVA